MTRTLGYLLMSICACSAKSRHVASPTGSIAAPPPPPCGRCNWGFPAIGLAKRWRDETFRHIRNVCRNSTTRTPLCSDGDIYEFGVFTGRALKRMAVYVENSKYLKPVLNNPDLRLFGFDSFRGLSQDDAAANNKFVSRGLWKESYATIINKTGGGSAPFSAGHFSATAYTGAKSVEEAVSVVKRYIGSKRVKLIPGFLNESLTPDIARAHRMRPALFVDIDVDIYRPTFEALDWMLRHRLIVRGTIVGFDDFNVGLPAGKYGGSQTWSVVRKGMLEGEPRALREIEDKWPGLRLSKVSSVNSRTSRGGQAGWVFTVLATGR